MRVTVVIQCMHWPAVEELIALGADVNVTLSQPCMEKWVNGGTHYKLAQGRVRDLWHSKMENLRVLRLTPEANQDSLFGLIHLAVRRKNSYHDAMLLRPLGLLSGK